MAWAVLARPREALSQTVRLLHASTAGGALGVALGEKLWDDASGTWRADAPPARGRLGAWCSPHRIRSLANGGRRSEGLLCKRPDFRGGSGWARISAGSDLHFRASAWRRLKS